MASLAESLVAQLTSPGMISKVSSQIGVDEATTSQAVSTAVPLLMAALARNASKPRGASSLNNALEEDHDGSVLDDLMGYLNNPNTDDGDGILRHTLGDQREGVQTSLAGSTGLDAATLGKLLSMAAPLVLGMLAKQKKQGGLNSDGLADMLNGETQALSMGNPQLMEMLTGILDSNDDGGIMDDLGRLAGRFFKKKPES